MKYLVKSSTLWFDEPNDNGKYYGQLTVSPIDNDQQTIMVDFARAIPPDVGDLVDGEIVQYQTSNGKNRQRINFTEPYKLERRQKAIYLGQAFNLALQHGPDSSNPDTIHEYADMYYDLLVTLAEEKLE